MRIYLAIGHKDLEEFIIKHKTLIEKNIKESVEFVGQAVYREAVIQGVKDLKPDLLLLRESLQGKDSISDVIYEIKVNSVKTRIIFIANERTPGDPFLASLVNMGIYDLLIGNKVNAKEMLKKIIYPNDFTDVANLVPKVNVDESTNQVTYETPEVIKEEEKEETHTSFDSDFSEEVLPEPVSLAPIKSVEKEVEKKPVKKNLFGKKKQAPTIRQQIITFVSGSEGVGSSHIAFNTAVKMANKGFNILYMDLNNKHSAIDTIFQLGYEDIGIDKALDATDNNDLDLIEQCMGSIPKALSVMSKKDYLYNSYTKLPSTLNYMFFSQQCMNGDVTARGSLSKFRALMQTLLKEFHFDLIILDAPANMKNPLTQMAIAYAEKMFVTVTQDNAVIAGLVKGSRTLDEKNINFRNKMNVIINKYEKCDFSTKNIYSLISGNLGCDNFPMYCLPNLNKEFISASFNTMPITLVCKNKELIETFNEIQKIIEA